MERLIEFTHQKGSRIALKASEVIAVFEVDKEVKETPEGSVTIDPYCTITVAHPGNWYPIKESYEDIMVKLYGKS